MKKRINCRGILLLQMLIIITRLFSGEIIDENNQYGGKTELIVPEDTTIREYLKNYFDETGFLMLQEEKMGVKSLVEVPFFLNRTFYSKMDPAVLAIERFTNPTAYGVLDQLYKDISWFRNGEIVLSYGYYFSNDRYHYKHVIKRKYCSDGSYEEQVVKIPQS